MSEQQEKQNIISHTIKEITQPFKELANTSKALFGVNLSYLIEGLTYFGIVGLLAMYFNEYVGLDDLDAGRMVGFLTGGITFAMLLLGATVDFLGVRKAFLLAIGLMFSGRLLLSIAPNIASGSGLWSEVHLIAMLGILGIILGYGIYQPAAYTAVKKFTDKKSSAMGYAMLYALMNLGGFLPGLLSPPVRKAYGIDGVFWVFTALTLVGMGVIAFIITNKAMKEAMNNNVEEAKPKEKKIKGDGPLFDKVWAYIKRIPVTDYRFMFFIFILIPVQTLFAHNWLTLPQYCERAFTGLVQDNFEFFVNINPLMIFILTPMITALTARKNTYMMMISGTAVMASAPFILISGPSLSALLIYLIVLTIGESMWQPRFLQWVAEIAPKDMTGIYMGFGQFPWFLTKVVTSIYSGWFLMNYCPDNSLPSETNTEMLWLMYGFIAIISPIGLILARKWMLKGFKDKNDE